MATDDLAVPVGREQERVEAMWNPGLGVIVVRNTASGDEVQFGEEAWWAFLDAHRPALDDSDRPHVEEARRILTAYGTGGLSVPATYGTGRALYDAGRTLLGLLDRIAPKEQT